MGRVCSEVHEWVEEQVEQPVEEFVGQWQEVCEEQDCNWWCLCCNKWLCWLAWVVVRVVTWVIVTVGKWVTRVVCEFVNIIVDFVAFLFELVLSIPVIGGIIRTILNWVTEIIWRIVGFLDFLASLAGVRPRKKMYFGVVIPSINGAPLASDADVMDQVNATIAFYDTSCNINMIFTGIYHTDIEPPGGTLVQECGAGGFFTDWWLDGSYYEFTSALCKFRDSFRRVIGLGSEIIGFVVQEILPGTTIGCSFVSTHNYVTIEARPGQWSFTLAHEIGHSCWLPHDESANNLMNARAGPTNPVLTNLQIATVRWSKHCVYI